MNAIERVEQPSVAEELGALLKLLSNPDRIQIVLLLADWGALTVNDVAAKTGISPARASQHLALLRAFRLVSRSNQGRHRLYSLNPVDLADWIRAGTPFIRYPMTVRPDHEHPS